jgi:O-acetyl-ADP-ribose deacetylase (regulator of RNase III)
MITFKQGDLFQDRAQALVNPVNCVGIMGKGIALQFKEKFPDNFREYAQACRRKRVQPGRMFVFNTYRPEVHRYIINFPTKRHWRDSSRIEDIKAGTLALAGEIRDRRIESVAIPALGSGLGGLDWDRIRPILESGLRGLENVRITVYEPMPAAPAGNARRGR